MPDGYTFDLGLTLVRRQLLVGPIDKHIRLANLGWPCRYAAP